MAGRKLRARQPKESEVHPGHSLAEIRVDGAPASVESNKRCIDTRRYRQTTYYSNRLENR
jgi:hypothetical protein